MNRTLGVCGLVVLLVAVGSAQTTMTGKCSKADVQQSIPAGDQQGHMFLLAQGKCTVNGKVNGVAAKEGAYSEHVDTNGTSFKNWGVYTVTFDNGDKIFYNYQGVGTMKDGVYQSGSNKFQVAGGTGKMKGAGSPGSCKLTGNKEGSIDYSCTSSGVKAAAAKKGE